MRQNFIPSDLADEIQARVCQQQIALRHLAIQKVVSGVAIPAIVAMNEQNQRLCDLNWQFLTLVTSFLNATDQEDSPAEG